MAKKRILLVSDVKGWGGWVRAEYIKKYLSNEFLFDIIDMNELEDIEERINDDGFTVNDLKEFKNISEDKKHFSLEQFKKFIRKKRGNFNYDLVYLLFHTMLVKLNVRRILDRNINVISIVTGFQTIKSCFYGANIENNNFKKLASQCKAIGANNYISLNDLKKYYKGKTFYATRGVDENVFYPLSSRAKKPHEKFVVAYVGKPVPEKGLDIIKTVCMEAGAQLIVNDRNFTNALGPDDMREFYNKADAYIVASTIDGTPNPALEAAACGKPIISNHIGNMPEFIKNGYNGFLLKKEHERNISKYRYWLNQLILNREKCFEMGMNAREEILKSWTWKKVTQNERKIFREVLKK